MSAHIFVYGTLRRGGGAPPELRRLLVDGSRFVGLGHIAARLHDAGAFPAAVPDPVGRVRGELYALGDPDDALQRLDRYEGASPVLGAGRLFRRGLVEVTLLQGEAAGRRAGREEAGGGPRPARAAARNGRPRRLTAWTYFYDRPVDGLPLVFSGDWTRR